MAGQQLAAVDAVLDRLEIAARAHVLGDQRRDRVGDAEAEIDHRAVPSSERRAARDRLAIVELGACGTCGGRRVTPDIAGS